MSDAVESERPKKIGGYDRWEVTSAVDSLRRAEEIKADPKFLEVVLGEMDRKAAKLEKTSDLLRKTKKQLGKVFGKDGKRLG